MPMAPAQQQSTSASLVFMCENGISNNQQMALCSHSVRSKERDTKILKQDERKESQGLEVWDGAQAKGKWGHKWSKEKCGQEHSCGTVMRSEGKAEKYKREAKVSIGECKLGIYWRISWKMTALGNYGLIKMLIHVAGWLLQLNKQ